MPVLRQLLLLLPLLLQTLLMSHVRLRLCQRAGRRAHLRLHPLLSLLPQFPLLLMHLRLCSHLRL